MHLRRLMTLVLLSGLVTLLAPPPADAQGRVAKRVAKEAAKDAAADAAKDAATDAAKGAAVKAVSPDAIDLNSASTEQMTTLGFDEPTRTKIVAGRPYTGLDDAKLKDAVSADVLKKLEGKITVKPVAQATQPD